MGCTVAGVSTWAGFLVPLSSGTWWLGSLGQRGFDLRTDNQVGQAPGGFGVRMPFIMARVLGMKSVPSWPGSRSG